MERYISERSLWDRPASLEQTRQSFRRLSFRYASLHIRQLECPLQRCALLVARWSGARRTEIRKLHLDCLDAYPDGTPRLRLAAGKSRKERSVPVHPEAAEAIEALAEIRRQQPDRGVYDAELGRPVRRLFLHNGRLASPDYLFAFPLQRVCAEAGLLDSEGKALVHPHRFRHTLGTQLEMGRVASSASFGRSREHALPAPQRTGRQPGTVQHSRRDLADLGSHQPVASGAASR